MTAPKLDLDALEALLAGDVTELPWSVDPRPVRNGSHEACEVRRLEQEGDGEDSTVPVLTSHIAVFDGWPKGDAALAVGAVNALPALIAEARVAGRLRRELEVERTRAAYWCAEYAIATNAPRSRAHQEAVVASEEAQAKLEALEAKP